MPLSGAAERAEKKALRHPAGLEESVSDSTPWAEVQAVSARAGATRDYAVRRGLLSREVGIRFPKQPLPLKCLRKAILRKIVSPASVKPALLLARRGPVTS